MKRVSVKPLSSALWSHLLHINTGKFTLFISFFLHIFLFLLPEVGGSEIRSQLINTSLTSSHNKAIVLQIKSLFHNYGAWQNGQKCRLMTAAVPWDWPCRHLKWEITEKERYNERKQAVRRPVWWGETGWNWPVAEPAWMGCFICQEKHWPPKMLTGWQWALVSEKVLISPAYPLHTLPHFCYDLFSSIHLLFPLLFRGPQQCSTIFLLSSTLCSFFAVVSLFVILLLMLMILAFLSFYLTWKDDWLEPKQYNGSANIISYF